MRQLSSEAVIIGTGAGLLVLWGLLRPRGIGGEVSRAAIRTPYQPVAFIPAAVPAPSGPFTISAVYRLRGRGDEVQALRVNGGLEVVSDVIQQLANCNLGELVSVDLWRISVRRGPHIISQYERSSRVSPARKWVRRGRDLGNLAQLTTLCAEPFCSLDPTLLEAGARSCL